MKDGRQKKRLIIWNLTGKRRQNWPKHNWMGEIIITKEMLKDRKWVDRGNWLYIHFYNIQSIFLCPKYIFSSVSPLIFPLSVGPAIFSWLLIALFNSLKYLWVDLEFFCVVDSIILLYLIGCDLTRTAVTRTHIKIILFISQNWKCSLSY